VLIGATAGARAEVDLREILRKRLHILGTVLRSRGLEEKIEVMRRFSEQTATWFAQGRLRTVVDSEFPLEQIQEAHRRVASEQTFGRVALRIGQ
jgi:NADPH2:quinone reductase